MRSYRDYFYPGTTVLRNLFDIRDADDLARAEAAITRMRMRQPVGVMEMSPDGLSRLHQHIFQDIYPFAGRFRQVDIEKVVEDGRTIAFEKGYLVERIAMRRFFHEIRADLSALSPGEGFRELDAKTFAYRAAVYLKDLNFIHPFPEGNGRVQRLFLEHLSERAGYRIDLNRIGRDDWLQGSIESFNEPPNGPHRTMTTMILGTITDHDHNRAIARQQKFNAAHPLSRGRGDHER